jgi:hypothetical protein
MANARRPGPIGLYSTSIDTGILDRTRMPQPGVIGLHTGPSNSEMEQAKITLVTDIGQLILDLTGIIDPTPISDGTNTLISLARGRWFDAFVSAVSIVPYVGDLAKAAKLPRYIKSVRKAIQIARFDPKWASALGMLFRKLRKVLDKCLELADDLLPDGVRKLLKELKDEIDNFSAIKGGAAGKPPGGGNKAGIQSSSKANNKGIGSRKKPAGKLDKKPENGYKPGKDNGPKTTTKPGSKPNEGLASGTTGEPMDPAKLERIKKSFESKGGVIDQSDDAEAYLRMRGAEGLTLNEKTILLPKDANTSAVYEELIHSTQFRKGMPTSSNVTEMEIQAAEKLIKNRKAYKIPNSETRQTIERLRQYRGQ